MRLSMAILAGLVAVAPPALAQDGRRGGSTEATLQITARGSVETPADDVTATAAITGTGKTDAAAAASARAKLDTMTRSLAAIGVSAAAITEQPVSETDTMMTIADTMEASATDEEGKTARRVVQIRVGSAAKLREVGEVLMRQDAEQVGTPTLALTDDAAARQAAIVKAVAKARADAETYAATIGMRVLRITRVTNQSPKLVDIDEADFVKRMATLGMAGTPSGVTTSATVTIEFAIGTR